MDLSSLGTTEWLVIAGVILLLVIIVVVVLLTRRRRRSTLSDRYGPEYERTVRAAGGERAARHDLAAREREREGLHLRDLDDAQRRSYAQRMAALQYRFTEDPAGAVYEAGRVAADALQARGYPITEDRDRALGLLGVDHPNEAQPLRTAIDGSYGKDQGRLRDTFIGVRDGLREVLGVHYGLRDASAGRPKPTAPAAGRTGAPSEDTTTAREQTTGPAALASDAARPSGEHPEDSDRSDHASAGDGRHGDEPHGDEPHGAHREGATESRDDTGDDAPDRTVNRDQADTPSHPVGTVPPEPPPPPPPSGPSESPRGGHV